MLTKAAQAVALAAFCCAVTAHDAPTAWNETANAASAHRILTSAANGGLNVIVTFKNGTTAPLKHVNSQKFHTRGARLTEIRRSLEDHAKKTQHSVFDLLQKGTFMRSERFWISNQLYVHGATPDLVENIKKHPSVLSVELEAVHFLVQPVMPVGTSDLIVPASWGTTKIKAPVAWINKVYGADVVVGVIDSGARWTHEALKDNYRRSFGWYDPEWKTAEPYDLSGHGTHVTGIIAGGKGVGVAPKAQWIACKGCRATGCHTADLLSCMQFMLCPSTPDGSLRDCTKAPDVINNSWAGNKGITTFNSAIEAWKAAGIIPIFAAGNSGPSCGSVLSPGDQPGVITVGATDATDMVASFSGKGPTINGLVKPDVTAPGNSIKSTCVSSDTHYCAMSGSSMATPHVTGTVALLLGVKPGLSYAQVRQALTQGTTMAVRPAALVCGRVAATVFPNNQYGFGRIDVTKVLAVPV
ncbi:hypothetical protein Poli38472_013345 [Pythium oligandrum]|uniref:subtilisin n=1 Tax=Pythium oligandrum TaxID=41045 RepID=A0A8K1FD24_PYTOL|nr:hypothetical protein Poli38472_013345 [Pythium oligandrum]|eukprot:TMW57871.1 hypothetical protein Poli38472_013345 [Pythium oligandrum]